MLATDGLSDRANTTHLLLDLTPSNLAHHIRTYDRLNRRFQAIFEPCYKKQKNEQNYFRALLQGGPWVTRHGSMSQWPDTTHFELVRPCLGLDFGPQTCTI
jgi:hypothetical protein